VQELGVERTRHLLAVLESKIHALALEAKEFDLQEKR
jgi:hypothetical protein